MYHPILVPIDAGTTADHGTHAAIGLAAELHASLQVLHDLKRALDRLRRHSDDLLATGTHGRRGMNRLAMGNTVESLARRTTLSLPMRRQPARSQGAQERPRFVSWTIAFGEL